MLLCGCVLLIYSPYLLELYNRFIDSTQNGTWVKPTESLGNLHDIIFWFANKNRFVYGMIICLFYSTVCKLFYQLEINSAIKSIFIYLIIPVFFLVSISIFHTLPFVWRLTELDSFTFIFITTNLLVFTFYFIRHYNNTPYHLFAIGSFIIPLIIFFAVSFYIPIWVDRYLIFILPSFYITLSMCIDFLFKRKYYYIAAMTVLSLMFYSFNPATTDHNDVDKMIHYVKKIADEESIIIINPKHFELTFSYHFDQDVFIDYPVFSQSLKSMGVYSIYAVPDLNEVKKHPHDHIIYINVNSNFLHPNNGVFEKLKDTHKLITEKTFKRGLHVVEFAKSQKVHNNK